MNYLKKHKKNNSDFTKLTISVASPESVLEESFGEELTWSNVENQKSCRMYVRKTANIKDRNDWNNQHHWLMEKLEKLKNN